MKEFKKLFLRIEKNAFVVSLICFFWFLLRTGRKPTRLSYPCQKIAVAQFSSYGLFLLPLTGIRRWIHFFTHDFSIKEVCIHLYKILVIFVSVGILSTVFNQLSLYQDRIKFENHRKHPIMGLISLTEPSGRKGSTNLFDHRVVTVHDTRATNWDYVTGMHWNFISQSVVTEMVSRGVMALTSTTNPVDAWSALIPYKEGEAVAIKVNFNNAWEYDDTDNQHDAFPETVNGIIDGLISIGVPPEKIWITDPSKVIPDRFRNKITHAGIQYYSAYHTGQRSDVYLTTYVDATSKDASPIQNPPTEVVRPAQVLVDAHHLINIPMMKGHAPSWVTLGLKNHYGSVIFKDHKRNDMHQYIYPTTADPNANPLGDINNNPHIRDKTRLVLGDALFGDPVINYARPPVKWTIFDDDSPNMLFFGVDPIAVESVMFDYLNEELVRIGKSPRNDDYLHYAAGLGLGIHEHWDHFSTQKYNIIDYIKIELGNTSVSGDSSLSIFPTHFSIDQNYPNPFNDQTTIRYSIPMACRVRIRIFNILGQNVYTLLDEFKERGTYFIGWNGKNDLGEAVSSGIYYYHITADQYRNTRKMLLLE